MAEWVSAIAACISATAIVFLALQVFLAKRQLQIASEQLSISAEQQRLSAEQLTISAQQQKLSVEQFVADHERSRREKAIDILERWNTRLDRAHPSARTLVNGFTQEQCEKLKEKKGFKVPKDKEDLIKNVLHGYLEEDPLRIEGESIILDDNHSSHIYFLCISHLNSLEIALQSWLVNVADEDILEEELHYLVKPEKGHYVLEQLRKVLGGKNAYPAIDVFVEHIKDKKNGGPGRRRKIAEQIK